MPARKMLVLTLAVLLAVVGSLAAWFFLMNDLPKKTPLRAKQVFYYQDQTHPHGQLVSPNAIR